MRGKSAQRKRITSEELFSRLSRFSLNLFPASKRRKGGLSLFSLTKCILFSQGWLLLLHVRQWEPPHLCGGRSALALQERVSTPITRFPGFPLQLGCSGALLAAFLNESRIRGRVQCGVQEIRVQRWRCQSLMSPGADATIVTACAVPLFCWLLLLCLASPVADTTRSDPPLICRTRSIPSLSPCSRTRRSPITRKFP